MRIIFKLLLAACIAASLDAETLRLGRHGTLSFQAPDGWKMIVEAAGEPITDNVGAVGCQISLLPNEGHRAMGSISVGYLPSPVPVDKKRLEVLLTKTYAVHAVGTVEGKLTLHPFVLSQGHGFYASFTAASSKGYGIYTSFKIDPNQPSPTFMVRTEGHIQFSATVFANIDIYSDDAQGTELIALLDAVSTMMFRDSFLQREPRRPAIL